MSGVHIHVRIGTETYAVPVEHVLEIAEVGDVAPVPGAPATVLGLRNLRGQPFPVLDLAALLGIEPSGEPARLLVADEGGRQAALAVDAVLGVGEIAGSHEEAESALLAEVRLDEGVLVGVVSVGAVLDAVPAWSAS